MPNNKTTNEDKKSRANKTSASVTGYGTYFTFHPTKSVEQRESDRLNEKFAAYAKKVEGFYNNYKTISVGSAEKIRNHLGENNVSAFIDLYKDIYDVDLSTTDNSKNVKQNIESLLEKCREKTKDAEKSSFAFTYARDDIQKIIPIIMKGIELRQEKNAHQAAPRAS